MRIVAGTTSGGASLVVREGIDDAGRPRRHDARHARRSATPRTSRCGPGSLEQGYATDTSGGGDVHITPQDNADTLAAFQSGALDGAWVPEPWATRLVLEGGGHVLVNEADLWPEGDFVTTHLIVATEYLDEHPDVIKALIVGLADAIDGRQRRRRGRPDDRQRRHRERSPRSRSATRRSPAPGRTCAFTLDPIASSLQGSADDAIAVGLLDPVDLTDSGHLRPRPCSTRSSPSAARTPVTGL